MQQQTAPRATPQVAPDWNWGIPVKGTVIRASAPTAKPAEGKVRVTKPMTKFKATEKATALRS